MVRITPAEYEATVEKIAKINARAAKKGFTGRVTVEAERVEKTSTNAIGMKVTEVLYEVTIGGEAPSYNGWTLAAVLDFDPQAGLIVNTAPGIESINREGLTAGTCAHCNTNRDRRKAYLVHNVETGEQVQVGSTCIKDFLGWEGNVTFIGEREVSEEMGGWGGFGGERRFTVDTVLGVAWACIRTHGFVPASSWGESTKDLVWDVLVPPTRMDDNRKAKIEALRALAPECAEMGTKVRDFILSDDFAGDSEYVRNLKALMAAENVGTRHIGFLASAPQAMARFEERTLVRKAKEEKPSNWFGQVGDKKVEFTGKIETIRFIPGDYGTTVLYSIRNEETGNIVKWFASREALGAETGRTVTIVGTIKNHEEFNGIKSTVFTRAKEVQA